MVLHRVKNILAITELIITTLFDWVLVLFRTKDCVKYTYYCSEQKSMSSIHIIIVPNKSLCQVYILLLFRTKVYVKYTYYYCSEQKTLSSIRIIIVLRRERVRSEIIQATEGFCAYLKK